MPRRPASRGCVGSVVEITRPRIATTPFGGVRQKSPVDRVDGLPLRQSRDRLPKVDARLHRVDGSPSPAVTVRAAESLIRGTRRISWFLALEAVTLTVAWRTRRRHPGTRPSTQHKEKPAEKGVAKEAKESRIPRVPLRVRNTRPCPWKCTRR